MAVLSYTGIKKSPFSTGKPTSLASKTIKNISNILLNKTSSKKNISNNILRYKNKRNENERRMRAQSELFASSSVTRPGGARRLALSQVGGSFLSRIAEFGAFMTAGWILTNMPTWIAGANELSNRIQSLSSTFTGFVDNIWDMMADIGRISGALYENMKMFDLTDSSSRVRNSMTGLIDTLDSMGDQIKEAFSVLTEPFVNVPPLGTKAGPGAYADVPPADSGEPSGEPPAPSGGTSGAYDIASKIGANREQWDIYRNTLAQIESGGRYDIPGGSGKHYDGRYQMGELAKKDAARILGIPYPGHSDNPNDPKRVAFRKNPELQERMFAAYTLANHGYLTGNSMYDSKGTVEQKLQVLGYAHNQGAGGASKWLRTGVVGRDGFNTKGTRYSDALARNFKSKVNPYQDNKISSSQQPSPQQQSPQRATSTPSQRASSRTPRRTSRYSPESPGSFNAIEYITGDRNHPNFELKGHGLTSNYHDHIAFATIEDKERAKRALRSAGIQIGSEFRQGSRTYHGMNLAIDIPGSQWGGSGAIGQKEFRGSSKVREILGLKSGATTPAEVSSPSTPLVPSSTPSTPQTPSEVQIESPETGYDLLSEILLNASLAANKQDIVLINDLQPATTQMSGGSGGGATLATRVSQSDLVNSFIKNKLLLDLNYL